MNTEMITVAIIGCGGRGKDTYAKAQKKLQGQMQIVAAVDINPKRLLELEMEYGVPRENCFCSVDIFLRNPKWRTLLLFAQWIKNITPMPSRL